MQPPPEHAAVAGGEVVRQVGAMLLAVQALMPEDSAAAQEVMGRLSRERLISNLVLLDVAPDLFQFLIGVTGRPEPLIRALQSIDGAAAVLQSWAVLIGASAEADGSASPPDARPSLVKAAARPSAVPPPAAANPARARRAKAQAPPVGPPTPRVEPARDGPQHAQREPLGGVADAFSPLVGRVAALVKGTVEQAGPVDVIIRIHHASRLRKKWRGFGFGYAISVPRRRSA